MLTNIPSTQYTNVRQKTPSTPSKTPNQKPNTPNKRPNIAVEIQKCEFVFQNFHLRFFVAKKIFVPNLRTLLVYFLQLKKYGGVKNMTNMRYAWP